ncbi:MAG: hypothetical protein ACI9SP_004713, partial [Arenicella sp.]
PSTIVNVIFTWFNHLDQKIAGSQPNGKAQTGTTAA